MWWGIHQGHFYPPATLCALDFPHSKNLASSSKQRSTWTQWSPCLKLCDSMTGISRLPLGTGRWRAALKSLTLFNSPSCENCKQTSFMIFSAVFNCCCIFQEQDEEHCFSDLWPLVSNISGLLTTPKVLMGVGGSVSPLNLQPRLTHTEYTSSLQEVENVNHSTSKYF